MVETDIKPDVTITDLPDASPSDPLEALSWLGETVEEVAEGLRARGIKGKISNAAMCPLHNYLAEFGWDYAITGGLMRNRKSYTCRWRETFPIIRDFVREFDRGSFPDLIDSDG